MIAGIKQPDEPPSACLGDWAVDSSPPDLPDRRAQVWAVRLDRADGSKEIGGLLNEDEHARAGRFVAEAPRRRFVLARATLRLLLGAYVGVDPARLAFEQTALGKPVLRPDQDVGIRFNVAHSDDLALVAFARGAEIGVDLERRRPLPEAEALAARYFAPIEARAIAALATAEQADAFLRCWTRKEAIVKATAEGLTKDFASFVVPSDAVLSNHVLEIPGPRGESALLALHTLEPELEYIGALAVDTKVTSVRVSTLDLGGIVAAQASVGAGQRVRGASGICG